MNARDFDTANAIDSRGPDLGRFSLPGSIDDVMMRKPVTRPSTAYVLFTANFSGGDGTIEDGLWGYYLERGVDGRWHIISAGVA